MTGVNQGVPIPTTVYVIATHDGSAVKVGLTSDVEQRLENLQAANPWPLVLIATFTHSAPRMLEGLLHRWLEPARLHHEWFDARHPLVADWLRHGADPDWLYDHVAQPLIARGAR